ncbi:hypothetical protein Ddye_023455 [Dipteronia dyeriana]|uniref:HhH-GPD domain-containing protein n=1 Tax=Dipteronia dyeriana TaxID=168575 RepID=A0AAD9TSY6_9ROSI|nr:hypothetical protein Ddye_023455 [Dipteronia dyeriana]
MMAPNNCNSSTKFLQRPLRLADSVTSLHVSISHDLINQHSLFIRVYHGTKTLSLQDQQAIKDQVSRMLRITKKDEGDVKEFQKLHGEAKDKGFGRLLCNPCLFEPSPIKCILLCNITWKNTLSMAQALCELQAELVRTTSKLVRNKCGNFPSSRELANMSQKKLKLRCNVGYRAKYIQQFAKNVESGNIDLNKFEQQGYSYDQLYQELTKNKGFGNFTCANVLMCIGFYHIIPTDSETLKLLLKVYSSESVEDVAKEIYDKYAPFQCLAYWLELINRYEKKVERLCELDKSKYDTVTLSEKIGDAYDHHEKKLKRFSSKLYLQNKNKRKRKI